MQDQAVCDRDSGCTIHFRFLVVRLYCTAGSAQLGLNRLCWQDFFKKFWNHYVVGVESFCHFCLKFPQHTVMLDQFFKYTRIPGCIFVSKLERGFKSCAVQQKCHWSINPILPRFKSQLKSSQKHSLL